MLSSVLAGCGAGDEGRNIGTKEASASLGGSVSKIEIEDDAGDLVIKGRKTGNLEIEVSVFATTDSEKDDKRALRAVDVSPEVPDSDASEPSVKVKTSWALPKGYGANVAITGDEALRLEIRDEAGDIEINDWKGSIIIRDMGGDIRLNNVEEYEIVSKVSGHLYVDGKKKNIE